MFAIVRTGGKQYRVAAGDKIAVEKLSGEAGDKISKSRTPRVWSFRPRSLRRNVAKRSSSSRSAVGITIAASRAIASR